VLPFLMRGLDAAPRRAWAATPHGALQLLYEDDRIAVVAKPAGMLSVPGKEQRESVLARLKLRYPEAMPVHRLDLDTSGVLLVALDRSAHRDLQRQFLERTVEKRYVAWVQGELRGDGGVIELPLRVDLDQRPRQCVCFEHGRPALTEWRAVQRAPGRTRVVLVPHTGRTHQLRVHAAHARGLAAPIIGDRLYGIEGPRLMLHAERLAFHHPGDHRRIELEAPAPF
jgi:tRNA pseudouridine32 synthase/23S rRNA pseudouridine746 synthase